MLSKPLGELCSFSRGASVPRARMHNSGSYLYIHYGDLYKGFELRVDVDFPQKPIPFINADERVKDDQWLHDLDIIYVLTSETVDDLGHSFLFNNPGNFPAVAGTETTIVRVTRRDLLVPAYLNYLMQSPHFKLLLRQYVKGMKVFRVHPADLSRIEIELPSLDEQQKIVALLDAIFERQMLTRCTNDYLAESALSIWKRYVQQSSEHMTIGEAAKEVITGKTPPTKRTELYGSDYPFITIPDMHGNVWFTSTERCLSEEGNKAQPKKIVNRGTVLVSCIATLGLVGIVSKPSHFNQQINAVVPKRAGEEYFLYCALLSVKQTLLGIGATGSATLNVNKGAFSGIDIPWLDDKSMDEYIQTVRPLFEAIEANSNECLRLTSLRDALLPKLMSGEIDVSGIEAPMQLNNHLADTNGLDSGSPPSPQCNLS